MGDLTDLQLRVIAVMVEGQSQREAADVAGVRPETVSRWVRHDALFAAELNRARSEVWDGRVRRVRDLTDLAIETVEDVLQHGDSDSVRLRAALAVLDRSGLREVGRDKLGATDPDEVRAGWVRDERSRQTADALTELSYMMDVEGSDSVMDRVLETEREVRALTE